MSASDTKEIYRYWTIVVTVGAWPRGNASQERYVPTVAVVPPEKLQQCIGGCRAHSEERDAAVDSFFHWVLGGPREAFDPAPQVCSTLRPQYHRGRR